MRNFTTLDFTRNVRKVRAVCSYFNIGGSERSTRAASSIDDDDETKQQSRGTQYSCCQLIQIPSGGLLYRGIKETGEALRGTQK